MTEARSTVSLPLSLLVRSTRQTCPRPGQSRYSFSATRTSSPSATAAPARPTWPWGWGLVACQHGMSVGFTTAATLVHELVEAWYERRLLNLQRQLFRLNLPIIDELGFVQLSRTGAELLFEVFSQRYEGAPSWSPPIFSLTSGRKSSARNTSPARCWTASPAAYISSK